MNGIDLPLTTELLPALPSPKAGLKILCCSVLSPSWGLFISEGGRLIGILFFGFSA